MTSERSTLFRRILALGFTLGLGGCHGSPAPTSAARTSAAHTPPPPPGPRVIGTGPQVVEMNVFQLTVPWGAVSRSDEFWKRVDESALEVATYDLLLKNGIRVGIGDNKDWPYFKSLIDNYHASTLGGASNPTQAGILELPLNARIDSEDLFWFDDHDVLFGRTFEHCDNVLTVTFEPHPHEEDHAIIEICPMIRGLRKRLEFTVRNQEREVEFVAPEQLLEVAVKADVPPDHFLIFAPTSDAKWPSSLGQAFFEKNGLAQRMETVLIFSPHTYRLMQIAPP
jgi:hypothetical protein